MGRESIEVRLRLGLQSASSACSAGAAQILRRRAAEESCSSCGQASPNLHESEGIPLALALHRQSVMTDVQAIDAITDGIIGAAIKVHRVLGPGLLHSAYLVCLTQ